MLLEKRLRQLSVGQRGAAVIALLLLPMAALSLTSVLVVNEQEITFRESVEESIHTLMPLTTLEHYLQRALVDEFKAQSHESVPNFAALTENIDKSFASIEGSNHNLDLQDNLVTAAHAAWRNARPSVRELIEQVRTLRPTDNHANQMQTRADLQLAIQDISTARQHLARAIEARYTQAVTDRYTQLKELIWSWIIILTASGVLIILLLRSLLRPIHALGHAARNMGTTPGVRVPIIGNDELTALAERFNEMASHWDATHKTLLAEAIEDPLTGALNRRGILAALDTALVDHTRAQQPLSILLLDLDHFKHINDHFGHAAGDRALVWVAGEMHDMLREDDRLGRYGGDEFLIVLPDTDKQQAAQIAQRMATVISEAAATEAAYPAISIGIACSPDDGKGAEALIKVADTALYEVKRSRPPQPPTADAFGLA